MPKSTLPGIALEVKSAEDGKSGEVLIYDTIGENFWTGEGVTAKSVAAALKPLAKSHDIDVRINSTGGDLFHGLAIYNQLNRHKANIRVHVEGIAASAASVIAMAGDEINIAENAMLMIHNPWTLAMGEAVELRETADLLDKWRDQITGIYSDRSGMAKEEIVKLLDAETWMTAEEAVEKGFATEITPNKTTVAASADVSLFRNVPTWAKEIINNAKENPMATEEKPSETATETPVAPVEQAKPVEAPVQSTATTQAVNAADILAAERKRVGDIFAACNLAGCPQLADQFIQEGASVALVQSALKVAMVLSNKPVGDTPSGDAPSQADENAKYKAEYKANQYIAKSMSEADYIATRRIDDEIDTLVAGSNKKTDAAK